MLWNNFWLLAQEHAFVRVSDWWDDVEVTREDRRYAAVMLIAQQPFFGVR